jgi:hypothetical protein
MKSGKADIDHPPGGRTEKQVAADVIVRLLEGGMLAPHGLLQRGAFLSSLYADHGQCRAR